MNKKSKIISHLMLVLGFSINSITGNSQSMYASFNLGYGLGSGTQSYTNRTVTNNSDILETINISLGKGINATGTFGYILSDNISAEIGVAYLISAKQEVFNNNLTRPRTRVEEYAGSMLKLNPTVVFSMPMQGSLQPYAKLGVVLGFGNSKYTYTNDDPTNNRLDIDEWKFNGGLGIGLNSAFGVYYSLNDNMKLFAELNITSLNYAPTNGELVTSTSNGVDQLPSLDTIDKEIIFVDPLDNNINISITNPDQALKVKLPYGSTGVNIGVTYNF